MKCKKAGMYDKWINRDYRGRGYWHVGEGMSVVKGHTVKYKFIPESEYPELPTEEDWYMMKLKGTACDPVHTPFPRVVRYVHDGIVYGSQDLTGRAYDSHGPVEDYDIICPVVFKEK